MIVKIYKTNTDKVIFDTYYRDRYFEDFIRKSDINIIRFTDISIKRFCKNENEMLLPYFSNGHSSEIIKMLEIING